MPKGMSYEEAKVRATHLANRKFMLELQRDGDLKYFEAAVLDNDGQKCEVLRRRLHDALDEYLDTVSEFITLARVAK